MGRGLGRHWSAAPTPAPPPGALSYFNQVGLWSRGLRFMEQRLSFRRWLRQQCALERLSQQQVSGFRTLDVSSSFSTQSDLQSPPENNARASQDTNQ